MSSSDDRLKRSFQESIALFRLRNENVLKALKLRDVKFRTVWPLTVMNGAKERVHKKLDDNGFNNRPFRVSRLILQRIRRVNLGPHLIMQLRDRGGDPHSRARLTETHISGSTPTKTTRKNLEFLRRARNSWNRAAAMPCCPVRFYRESLAAKDGRSRLGVVVADKSPRQKHSNVGRLRWGEGRNASCFVGFWAKRNIHILFSVT